jgi:hypothetical protein
VQQAGKGPWAHFKIRVVLGYKKIFHHGETENHGEQQNPLNFSPCFSVTCSVPSVLKKVSDYIPEFDMHPRPVHRGGRLFAAGDFESLAGTATRIAVFDRLIL